MQLFSLPSTTVPPSLEDRFLRNFSSVQANTSHLMTDGLFFPSSILISTRNNYFAFSLQHTLSTEEESGTDPSRPQVLGQNAGSISLHRTMQYTFQCTSAASPSVVNTTQNWQLVRNVSELPILNTRSQNQSPFLRPQGRAEGFPHLALSHIKAHWIPQNSTDQRKVFTTFQQTDKWLQEIEVWLEAYILYGHL